MEKIKINQMDIGLTKELKHESDSAVGFLAEGKGFFIYSAIEDGLRISIHSSDGLDTYYFDIDRHHLKGMLYRSELIKGERND